MALRMRLDTGAHDNKMYGETRFLLAEELTGDDPNKDALTIAEEMADLHVLSLDPSSCRATIAVPSGYSFSPYTDSPGGDLKTVTGDFSAAASECDIDPSCMGFFSDGLTGYLKENILPEAEWRRNHRADEPCLGMFVKSSDPSSCIATIALPSGYYFSSYADSPGGDLKTVAGEFLAPASECDTDPSCMGFFSDSLTGCLKEIILPEAEWTQNHRAD